MQRLGWLVFACFLVVGCRTTPAPEVTEAVVVEDDMVIAVPAPLEAISLPLLNADWPSEWTNQWISLETWGRYHGLESPVQTPATPARFTIRAGEVTMAVRIGSRIAECNGLTCWLGYAPQLIKGLPFIHHIDARKTLQPLLLKPAALSPRNRVIVLDPGHGGRDPGTKSCLGNHYEKDYTLDWAHRLKTRLQQRGWKVFLTRTNDIDISLQDRVTLAEKVQADLFLSLHFNSGNAKSDLAGVETYCLTPTGLPSHLQRFDEDNISQTWPNNAYDEQNIRLAWRMHQSVVKHTGATDRGVRRARFMSVLRGQNRSAVLIEAGYLSNPAEATKISTAAYRDKLAEAVANGLE